MSLSHILYTNNKLQIGSFSISKCKECKKLVLCVDPLAQPLLYSQSRRLNITGKCLYSSDDKNNVHLWNAAALIYETMPMDKTHKKSLTKNCTVYIFQDHLSSESHKKLGWTVVFWGASISRLCLYKHSSWNFCNTYLSHLHSSGMINGFWPFRRLRLSCVSERHRGPHWCGLNFSGPL